MGREAAGLRRAIAVRRAEGLRLRLREPLRSRVLAYVGREREAGRSYQALARALGVPAATVQGWSAAAKAMRGFGLLRPVRVARTPAGGASEPLVLIAPGGYRVEGLTLEGVRVLLEALGG